MYNTVGYYYFVLLHSERDNKILPSIPLAIEAAYCLARMEKEENDFSIINNIDKNEYQYPCVCLLQPHGDNTASNQSTFFVCFSVFTV